MHSSRMRSTGFIGYIYLGTGEVCPGGMYLQGVCPGECGKHPPDTKADTPDPLADTPLDPEADTSPVDRRTGVKTLPCSKLRLQAVINVLHCTVLNACTSCHKSLGIECVYYVFL